MIHPHENLVCIVGLSGTGKSHLSYQLSEQFPEYKVFHCDDYLTLGKNYGDVDVLTRLLVDITYSPHKKKIIEGSLCYRLLRKGAKDDSFLPDLVIMVISTQAARQIRRPDKDYTSFDQMYRRIWRDYITERKLKTPRIVEIDTTGNI
jgi:uridine kinase